MPETIRSTTINHLLILDESASMQSIRNEAICSFNDTVNSIRNDMERSDFDYRLTYISFNGKRIKQHFFNVPISNVAGIGNMDFCPEDGSPLMDALGLGMGLARSAMHENLTKSRVVVTIVTDGGENGSTKYCKSSIARLIEHFKECGWIFNYIGANHDVGAMCGELNIDNYYVFKNASRDVKRQLLIDRLARQSYEQEARKFSEKDVQIAA